ncbi:MAG: hypothetical protein J0M00_18595 [Burkholderiales bacterium]|nr:hypothetical protein [Burkholderiales bacterium]
MTPIQVADMAQRLADAHAIELIRANSVPEQQHGRLWFDTRPMLDERERSGPDVDRCSLALQYAHQRGLISPHPEHAHLVRITKAGA